MSASDTLSPTSVAPTLDTTSAAAAALMNDLVRRLGEQVPPAALASHELEPIYAGALAELEAGRLVKAEHLFGFLTSQAPMDARFAEGLGIAHARQGHVGRAIVMLSLAAQLAPTAASPLLHLAELMAGEGLRTLASPLFRAARALARRAPQNADIERRADAMLEILHAQGA